MHSVQALQPNRLYDVHSVQVLQPNRLYDVHSVQVPQPNRLYDVHSVQVRVHMAQASLAIDKSEVLACHGRPLGHVGPGAR